MNRRIVAALIAGMALFAAGAAPAQTWPTKPITVVLPFPAGGGGDAVIRPLAKKIQEALGQPVIVDSKPGASQTIGAAFVASAPPDGYTLLAHVIPTHVNIAAVVPNLSYDPIRSFIPVGQFVSGGPQFMLVRPSLGVNTFEEFMVLAKAKPGTLTYGSQGAGTIQHLIGELMRREAGIDWVHVPFRGGAPALQAILGDHIDVLLTDATSIPSIVEGKVKALMVTTEKRVERFPDLRTVAELGYANATTDIGFVLFAPAGTPRPIVDRLNGVLATLPADPDMQAVITRMSARPMAATPEEITKRLESYAARYHPVIRSLDLKVD